MNRKPARITLSLAKNISGSMESPEVANESLDCRDKPLKRRCVQIDKLDENQSDSSNEDNDGIFTAEDSKKRLSDSIIRWGEILLTVNTADQDNKKEFDDSCVLSIKTFSNVQQLNIFENDSVFARQIFFDYLKILDIPAIHHFLNATSWTTLSDAIFDANVYSIIYIITTLVEYVQFHRNDLPEKYDSLLNSMRIYVEQRLQSSPSTFTDRNNLHSAILTFIWNLTDQTLVVPCLIRTGFGKSILERFCSPILSDRDRESMISIIHNLSRHDEGVDELNKYDGIGLIKSWQQQTTNNKWEITFITTMTMTHLYSPDQIKADPSGTKSNLDQLLQVTIHGAKDKRHRYEGFHISEPLSVMAKVFVNDATLDYVLNHAQTDPPSNLYSTIDLFANLLIEFLGALSKKNQLDQFTFIALCNIIWSISFHDAYHSILKEKTELIDTIRLVAQDHNLTIVEQYVPRTMLNIKKAADGILFNLDLEQSSEVAHYLPPLPLIPSSIEPRKPPTISSSLPSVAAAAVVPLPRPPPPPPPSQIAVPSAPFSFASLPIVEKPLVMISYCHANNAFCDKILELLDRKADLFDVWIDRRRCKSSGDVWESIARGIKSAQLIICIISTEYMASKACRQEIIYAKDRLNKLFLPVYMEKPTPSDWLDIRLAEFKYVRFQNVDSQLDERKVQEFLSTLIESILPGHEKSTDTLVQHHHHPSPNLTQSANPNSNTSPSETKILTQSRPTTHVSSPFVPQWTSVDIHSWFEKQQISSELRDLYDFKTGAQMITYAECLNDGWQKQYERYAPRYADRYKGKDLSEHEFALFASALKELRGDYMQKFGSGNSSILTSNPQQSCWCIIL